MYSKHSVRQVNDRPSRAKLLCSCSFIAILTTGMPAGTDAREIGVTAAVRPQVHGTPPEQEARILNVGVDLFANERIVTGSAGRPI